MHPNLIDPSWQHEQGSRFLPEQVMEASHSNPESSKEGCLFCLFKGKVTYSLLI
jgi:hypothetical protein